MNSIKLNDNQLTAVKHLNGPMMVLAGPGSGKTTVVTCRVVYMIKKHNIHPEDILVIAFTKSSTVEMKERFLFFNKSLNTKVHFATFHSLFYSIIRKEFGYTLEDILSEEEKREFLTQTINSQHNSPKEEDYISNIINELSQIKNQLIDLEYYNSVNMATEDFVSIYNKYERYKTKNNKIDFDDMLLKAYNILCTNKSTLDYWQEKYKYILIDEFQDINTVQYESIKLLAKTHTNLFIVGDDDQSIYKFRGANPEFLLNFGDDFVNANSITLNINYRSTDEIIKLSNVIISQNKNRYSKDIQGTGKTGDLPFIIKHEDANMESINIASRIKELQTTISFDKIAVVYRTNMQSRAFVDTFMHLNIPYQVKDLAPSIYEHWVTKDIFAYFKLAFDRNDDYSFRRIINKPSRYISKAIIKSVVNKKKEIGLLDSLYNAENIKVWQISKLEELMFYLNAIKTRKPFDAIKYIRQAVDYNKYIKDYSEYRKMNYKELLEILDELQESSKSFETIENFLLHAEKVIDERKDMQKNKNNLFNGITLSTIHSVKGLEFDIVFLVSAVDGIIPYEKSKTETEIEEECRLFYVGMTRAKSKLYISIIQNRHEKEVLPSRFLDPIFV